MASTFSTRKHHHLWTVLWLGAALVCLLAAGTLGAEEPSDVRRAAVRKSTRRGPSVEGKTPNALVIRRLYAGYGIALKKVHKVESCADLFSRLGADGIEVLSGTTYTFAKSKRAAEICADANAFTTVGGSTVWICGGFGWLTEKDAAKVLIHEALHDAGLGEQPSDPDGPTPEEIDAMVKKKCGL
jgi:hypothetical protein